MAEFDPKILGGSVKRGIVNPDLHEERQKCDFDQKELASHLFGNELVDYIDQVSSFVERHPETISDIDYFEMSREEKFTTWWRRYKIIMQSEEMHQHFSKNSVKKSLFNWSYLFAGTSPLTLHQSMFTDSLKNFATEEQKAHYIPQADNLNIIGCYAQTELGHGSNVAGLETTATYCPQTEQFTIHSPTIKAAKFWPGALGVQSTHAVLFARCISLENDYGVTPFILQIRDMETHEPLPGIEVGDIGQKLGYNSIDNGYLLFTNVKVPRSAMLSRFTEITKEGDFELKSDPRLLYQIMSLTRLAIIKGCAFNLFRSGMIAIRYSVCRRQFSNQSGSKEERKLLDYQVHMEMLGKQMGNMMAIWLAGNSMQEVHEQAMSEFNEGEFKSLDILHHLTAGVKSMATEMCYVGLDEMRQSCGGAGFLLSSGIADQWSDIAPFPTFEGVNPVMAQQASRFIFKNYKRISKGKKPNDELFSYLTTVEQIIARKSTASTVQEFVALDHIENTLAARAGQHINQVDSMMKENEAHKKVQENEIFALDIARMTRIHLVYVTFKLARTRIEKAQYKDQNVRKLQELCIKIFALKQLSLDHQILYECGYFGQGSGKLLDQAYRQLLIDLRPQMVSLVESFPQGSKFVPSTIGNAYGDIYEMQYETAKNSKLNHGIVPKFYQTHMKPVMTLRTPQVPKL